MDKNAIKKYAVWAREELISRVTQRAIRYGMSEKEVIPADATSIHGMVLSSTEIDQRRAFIKQINTKGYNQAIEEVAYTWFNRFSALRFMEVNGYLPSHVRVFTDESNQFKPQILSEAINLDTDGLDMEHIYELKEVNDEPELFKYLIIAQCNALSDILPGIFQEIDDYTELLFPDNLLRTGSVIEQMVTAIPQDDWLDAVEIIGWLYQYYINAPKDALINAKKQYKSKDVPFVTQIFTSEWIVQYMVQNSLGRLWLDSTGEDFSTYGWDYYLESKDRKTEKSINPEELRIIDPCMGSGHILVYVFDVLMQMYEKYGFTTSEAVETILRKNIYGFDISERAYQLAYFSVMMKARKYNRTILRKKIKPNLFLLKDVKSFDETEIDFIANGNSTIRADIIGITNELAKLGEYGSLITTEKRDFEAIFKRIGEIKDSYYDNLVLQSYQKIATSDVLDVVKIAYYLYSSYDCVITNPPYIGNRFLPSSIRTFIEKNYKEYKSDIFSAFIVRVIKMCKPNGHIGMLTPYVWMYISTFEPLRNILLGETNISSLVQLEYNAFEAACVPVCTFTLEKNTSNSIGEYIQLSEFRGSDIQGIKVIEAVNNNDCKYRYSTDKGNFYTIPGVPIAYWITNTVLNVYKKGIPLGEIAAPRKGNSTSDNDRFLRIWHEVDYEKINLHSKEIIREDTIKRRWYPYNKGGGYRKWYGYNEYLIDWYDDAIAIRSIKTAVIANYQYFMKPGLTWSTLSSKNFSIRWFEEGYIFDNGGCCIFELGDKREYLCGLLNSVVFKHIFGQLNPTLNFQSGEVAKFPVIMVDRGEIISLVRCCVDISKAEYDSFEDSWDFKRNPLVPWIEDKQEKGEPQFTYSISKKSDLVETYYTRWECESNNRFIRLKSNEEELNRIFIDIYELNDELTPEVEDKDVTVRKAELQRDIKSLISYAVGCMFGRYSLDREGLIFAGGEWDNENYKSFPADKDNIIPISDDEYFEDDIANRFVDFIRTVYGESTLNENLKFIADALGGKGHPKEVIRNYFLNDFYADHLKIYQKRPIYWLFDSGKKNGFKCLIYMHRYQPDTIARIRTDYVHEQQSRYRTSIADLEKRVASASTSEKVKLTKQLSKLKDQAAELHEYEEKIHHLADQYISIDLDNGVKVNYAKFQDVLAKIK